MVGKSRQVLTARMWEKGVQTRPGEAVEIWTDGSGGQRNVTGAGWGFVVVKGGVEIHAAYGPVLMGAGGHGAERGTNNTGEITAVIEAMRWVESEAYGSVTIVYDSEIAAKMTQGAWRAKANKGLVANARRAFRDLKKRVAVSWRWVKGHSGERWNERADELAGKGAAMAPPPAKGSARGEEMDWTPKGGPCAGPPEEAVGQPPRDVRWVGVGRTEAERVVRRATTRFGVLNMRVPMRPIDKEEVFRGARRVVSRIREEEADGKAGSDYSDMAVRKVMAVARALAGGREAQKRAIDERRGREAAVHALDVDIDTVRLRAAVGALGDTGPVRTCLKHMREILKTARHVRDGVVRHRITYVHSELGRDMVEAGHVTGCRLSARGPDPFKWDTRLREAALHGAWNADDTACYPTARQAMTGGMGGVAAHFLRHREEILARYGEKMFGTRHNGMLEKEKRALVKRITTAYDMGAALDFWRELEEYKGASIRTLSGVNILVGRRVFSLEAYRSELAAAAAWMAERAGSMLDYVSQGDCRSGKRRGKRRRQRTPPAVTLKSFVLQEAEAVGREAKIRAAAALGLRVVNLQHDGVVVAGMADDRKEEVARVLSEAVTASCGYESNVTLEKVRSVESVD